MNREIDEYSFETQEEKDLYFLEKIIEQSQRKTERLEQERERIILTQMEKQVGI